MNQSIKLAITWPPDLLYETINLLLLNLQTIHYPTGYAIWNQKCKCAPYPQLKSHFSLGDNNHFNKLKSPQPHLTKVSTLLLGLNFYLKPNDLQTVFVAGQVMRKVTFSFFTVRKWEWSNDYSWKSPGLFWTPHHLSMHIHTFTFSLLITCIRKTVVHERTAWVPWASVNTSAP